MIARVLIAIALASATVLGAPSNAQAKSRWDEPCTKNSPIFNPLVPIESKLLLPAVSGFQKNPNDQDLFYLAGWYYLQKHNLAALEKLAIATNKAHPDWAAPYYFFAKVADANIEDETAMANYKKAYELKPCWESALISYSDVLQLAGRSKEAMEVVDTGLSVCDHSEKRACFHLQHTLLQSQARIFVVMGHPELAIKPLEKAVPMLPPSYSGIPIDSLANAYMQTKQWKKAIAVETKRVSAEAKVGVGHLLRAKAYYGDGQLQKALDDTETFLTHLPQRGMDRDAKLPQIKEAHLLRADIFDKQGKKDLAKKERELSGQGTAELYKNTPFRAKEPGKR